MFSAHQIRKYAPPLARWGVAGFSVVLFLAFDDLPAILLETPYGQPVSWRDVRVAAGLAQPLQKKD